VTKASIAIDDWIRYQQYVHNAATEEAFIQGAYQDTVTSVKEDINEGTTGDIPAPVVEISYDGTVSYDEGRSRGLGAKRAGMARIPVWIVARDHK
jgi:hypothetical protein